MVLNEDRLLLPDAIQTYNGLLTDSLAADSQALLDEMQPRRHLGFSTRPLCTVLRPRFLSPDEYRFLRQRVGVLMGACRKIHEAGKADATFRAQYRLSPEEDELLTSNPGFDCPYPTSRLDAFFVSFDELKFTEFNAETPAGAGYIDVLAEVFQALPIMAAFKRHYHAVPLPARPGVLHSLLHAFAQWQGHRHDKPRIAILDWKEVPTFNEFLLFQDYFRSVGLECHIIDPREVEYRDGKLLHGDYHITLIYKRVLISELLERGGLNHPVVRAVRAGAVCMANSFHCKMLYKKASLAVLSDERNAHLYSPAEAEVIRNHVPWTRVVEERKTTYAGATVDLVPFLLENRATLVLKPNDDYGGKGIVLGWTVNGSEWEQAVKLALTTPYVAQERVRLPAEPFPAVVDGKLHVSERLLDTAPFVCYGDFVDGCLTRIATDPLLNVTAGGGSTVSTFLIEPR